MGASLTDQVRKLLDDCLMASSDADIVGRLTEARGRLDEPLRVAIVGKVKAGKSTLLNALVGEELAPTDAGECTRIVTWYREGVTYRVTMRPREGEARPARFHRGEGAIEVDLGGAAADDVDSLVVEWPSSALHDTTLIDTPGLASLTTGLSEQTHSMLAMDADSPGQADAVLYLMRHLHADDAEFLEAFAEDIARGSPVNAIGVVSRADEVAAGRLDALESARRIAERYRSDPLVRRLCQTVIPVAGLLAQAGTAVTETEFRALRTLADAPREDTERLLLTADRFLNSEATIALEPAERAQLAARLGLFGVRLAVTLLRDDKAMTSAQLARELITRSGIEQLREVLRVHFASQGEALKARSALAAAQSVLHDGNGAIPGSERLAAEIERIEAGAHVFAEMRLITVLRGAPIGLDDGERDDAERLLGAAGHSIDERLGLPPGSAYEARRDVLVQAIGRWQQRAESPLSGREAAEAARILVRSCEGMLADLAAPVPAPAEPAGQGS